MRKSKTKQTEMKLQLTIPGRHGNIRWKDLSIHEKINFKGNDINGFHFFQCNSLQNFLHETRVRDVRKGRTDGLHVLVICRHSREVLNERAKDYREAQIGKQIKIPKLEK